MTVILNAPAWGFWEFTLFWNTDFPYSTCTNFSIWPEITILEKMTKNKFLTCEKLFHPTNKSSEQGIWECPTLFGNGRQSSRNNLWAILPPVIKDRIILSKELPPLKRCWRAVVFQGDPDIRDKWWDYPQVIIGILPVIGKQSRALISLAHYLNPVTTLLGHFWLG